MPKPTHTTTPGLRELIERSERLFPSYPQVGRYFPAATIESARQRLSRTIERGDGPGLVVGAAGTGKSMLLQVLAAQFQDRFDVVLLACARVCTRRALLKAILFEMGLRHHVRDEGELRLSLLDHLLSVEDCPAGLLLLVDEAQSLSPPLLDELRVLTNLVRGGAPRVRLVLAGSAALEESFANPELESFSQRLAARCYLAPFNREETVQFIRAQIAAGGGGPDQLVAANAWTTIFEATDGVPRLINQLCDRALLVAEAQHRERIERDVIQAAWAELQQLPTQWVGTTTTRSTSEAEAIEFGGLTNGPAEVVSDGDQCFVIEPTELDDESASSLTVSSDAVGDGTITSSDLITPRPVPVRDRERGYELASSSTLDHDEDRLAVGEGGSAKIVLPPLRVPDEPTAINPFAEQFDEEEMVLDSFAAWDEIFHREVPRVENRRDPGFSGLVQAALDASPGAGRPPETPAFKIVSSHAKPATASQDRGATLAFENESADAWDDDLPGDDYPGDDKWSHWPSQLCPPLRLADVSEHSQPAPDPRLGRTTLPGAVAYDTQPYPAAGRASDWIAQVAIDPAAEESPPEAQVTTLSGRPWEELPVLVIDEDSVPVPNSERPTVRRAEYRDLFSRLRGV